MSILMAASVALRTAPDPVQMGKPYNGGPTIDGGRVE